MINDDDVLNIGSVPKPLLEPLGPVLNIGSPSAGGAPGGMYFLDNYPVGTTGFAASLRQLHTTATRCIRVRRSSDNAEQDIGFVAGELDTVSLLAFVGVSNGHVTIWYDQTPGATLHAVQTVASNQPAIAAGGVVALTPDTGKPYMSGSNGAFAAFFFLTNLALYRNRAYNRYYYTYYQFGTGAQTRNKAMMTVQQNVLGFTYRTVLYTGNSLSSQHQLILRTHNPDGAAASDVLLASTNNWASATTLINMKADWSGGTRQVRIWSPNVGVVQEINQSALGASLTSDTDSGSIQTHGINSGVMGFLMTNYFSELIIYGTDDQDASNLAMENDIKGYWQ